LGRKNGKIVSLINGFNEDLFHRVACENQTFLQKALQWRVLDLFVANLLSLVIVKRFSYDDGSLFFDFENDLA
jgi:hypothetical protein